MSLYYFGKIAVWLQFIQMCGVQILLYFLHSYIKLTCLIAGEIHKRVH